MTTPQNATLDDLKQAAKELLPIGYVDVGAPLNRRVWFQGLTALQRTQYENSYFKGPAENRKLNADRLLKARARLIVRCAIRGEEDRALLMSEADVEWLSTMGAQLIEPMYDKCRELCGMSKADMDELEQLSAEVVPSASASS